VTRVVAGSRLHFGLFHPAPLDAPATWPGLDGEPGPPRRQFGGVGLMVDRPGVTVAVEPAAEWSASGPLAGRALGFARAFAAASALGPHRVTVESAAPEHAGLGTGTQLALAVARALAASAGLALSAVELAERVGRGRRSGVGVHGFERGGLVVEAGRPGGRGGVAPLAAHALLPAEWVVVLGRPAAPLGLAGAEERAAFGRLDPAASARLAGDLARLTLLGMLPAAAEGDCDGFGEAVYEFNARVGDAFAAEQGGRYASAAVADLVRRARAAGVRGVGQSSWGPTAFAVAPDADRANAVTDAWRSAGAAVEIARPCRGGTVVGGGPGRVE
jgi:beta-ribofuranosylaminobenzene 5'-phosphate synthase